MLAKTYYSGRVTGMADRAAALGKARDTVLQECVLGVQEATSAGQPLSQLITRCVLGGEGGGVFMVGVAR